MLRFALFVSLLLACALPASADTLSARVISWDLGFKPESAQAWTARLESELNSALNAGADAVVFPELMFWGLAPFKPEGADDSEFITKMTRDTILPKLEHRLKTSSAVVVLGSYPHKEAGWTHAQNRAVIWHEGRWLFQDKLRPTQGEEREKPPIRPGDSVTLLDFRGGKAAVLICFDVEMPEVTAALKRRGVQLLLVPSATADAEGLARVRRAASSRAVELGAAVLVASLTGSQGEWANVGGPALYLPAQKGLDLAAQEAPSAASGMTHRDFSLPWMKIMGLHLGNPGHETRPFSAAAPDFKVLP